MLCDSNGEGGAQMGNATSGCLAGGSSPSRSASTEECTLISTPSFPGDFAATACQTTAISRGFLHGGFRSSTIVSIYSEGGLERARRTLRTLLQL